MPMRRRSFSAGRGCVALPGLYRCAVGLSRSALLGVQSCGMLCRLEIRVGGLHDLPRQRLAAQQQVSAGAISRTLFLRGAIDALQNLQQIGAQVPCRCLSRSSWHWSERRLTRSGGFGGASGCPSRGSGQRTFPRSMRRPLVPSFRPRPFLRAGSRYGCAWVVRRSGFVPNCMLWISVHLGIAEGFTINCFQTRASNSIAQPTTQHSASSCPDGSIESRMLGSSRPESRH